MITQIPETWRNMVVLMGIRAEFHEGWVIVTRAPTFPRSFEVFFIAEDGEELLRYATQNFGAAVKCALSSHCGMFRFSTLTVSGSGQDLFPISIFKEETDEDRARECMYDGQFDLSMPDHLLDPTPHHYYS